MKYINLFDTQAEYDEAQKYYPNVSYIEATDEVVYQETDPGPDYSKEYLTFEALESGTFSYRSNYQQVQYSIDGGDSWLTLASNTQTPTINQGEKISWKASVGSYWITFDSTGRFNAEGNIMSLIYSDDFENKTSFPDVQTKLDNVFKGNSNIISAENLMLPATTLTANCYENMFNGCTSLTTAPELPATTLTNYCYGSNNSESGMFRGCTSLTTAPELPATTLGIYCYCHMFYGCTSLTTAPELPATTLTIQCYMQMFFGCTSLTTAPELPATTLTYNCYNQMFGYCSSLNYIKMLATDISATNCLNNWVKGVQTTSGTFTKAASMSTLPTGDSGIPANWTVVDIN